MIATVLFGLPQQEIASLIADRMARSSAISVVTGFATPGGLTALSGAFTAQSQKLRALVVGAATYPGFAAFDAMLAAGVAPDRLHVHLGHTSATRGRKNPFARYHPMLHSKVYYMELPDEAACVFIGSHNVTAFALTGLNGEASVLLEGPRESPEFDKVRQHIDAAQSQSVVYSSGMKEAYAWWTREFLDGLKAEVRLPQDGIAVRTILLFASAASSDRPETGDHLYFDIPAGIQQIESLKTETHLFLFDTLPANPWQALSLAQSSNGRYTCTTLGAENQQGNKEIVAHWRIDGTSAPRLTRVESGIYRPSPPAGMEQVRAEIKAPSVQPFEYLFERESQAWDPEFAPGHDLKVAPHQLEKHVADEARGGHLGIETWRLVKGLARRSGSPREKDEAALRLAAPEGRRWAFTLSNAGAYYFEDRADLASLPEIDWAAVAADRWSGQGISSSVKHGKQAEFLVEESFPWELVGRIGVSTREVGQRVGEALGACSHRPSTEIRKDWYYGA